MYTTKEIADAMIGYAEENGLENFEISVHNENGDSQFYIVYENYKVKDMHTTKPACRNWSVEDEMQ